MRSRYCLQVWDISRLDFEAKKPAKLKVTAAVAAHDKDINAVAGLAGLLLAAMHICTFRCVFNGRGSCSDLFKSQCNCAVGSWLVLGLKPRPAARACGSLLCCLTAAGICACCMVSLQSHPTTRSSAPDPKIGLSKSGRCQTWCSGARQEAMPTPAFISCLVGWLMDFTISHLHPSTGTLPKCVPAPPLPPAKPSPPSLSPTCAALPCTYCCAA
jgi:hypothetical protein